MGSALSQTLETETTTPEEIGQESIKDQPLQIKDQPKEKSTNVNNENEKMSTSSSSKTLESETKTPEEIDTKSIKDQPLQIIDQPKEKSSNVNTENEKVSTSSSSKTLESETKTPEEIDGEEKKDDDDDDDDDDEEEEEEEECGFCLFMKSGGCEESFVAWENCIEAVEKEKRDIVEKCFEVTSALKKCMEEHPDHYGPILQAEKAAAQEVRNELEKRKLEEEEANKSVDKEAILEVEKDGVVNEAVVKA